MSIILKGINMPKDTVSIEISFNLEDGSNGSTRIYKTSAIQIDRPHGRLIDGDKIEDELDERCGRLSAEIVRNAPTILEAEEN